MKRLLLFLSFALEWFACNGQAWKTTKSRGMAYQPVPKGVNPSTSGYLHDTDLFNTDFQALWGVDPRNGVVSRNDLLEMVVRGVNSLHIYNWNSEPGERDHLPFLDYAATFQTPVKVWVPISNFLFQNQWDQRQTVLANIVNSTKTKSGAIHKSVFGWLIANEYDLHPDITPQMVSEVIAIIAGLDPDSNRPFSIPVSSAAGYNNNPNPGLGALIELHGTLPKSIWSNRYIHSVNPFLPFDALITLILDPYLNQFGIWKENPVPLQFTEIGRSEFDVGSDEQTLELTDLACGFSYLQTIKSLNPYNFVGYYIFEYTREDWKGEAEELYGMNALGEDISDPANPATTLKPAPGNDDIAAYPVNVIGPIPGWVNAFQVQQLGFASPICDEFTKRHATFAQAAENTINDEEVDVDNPNLPEPVVTRVPTSPPVGDWIGVWKLSSGCDITLCCCPTGDLQISKSGSLLLGTVDLSGDICPQTTTEFIIDTSSFRVNVGGNDYLLSVTGKNELSLTDTKTPSCTVTATKASSSSGGMSGLEIALIVIGVLIGICIIVFGILYFVRKSDSSASYITMQDNVDSSSDIDVKKAMITDHHRSSVSKFTAQSPTNNFNESIGYTPPLAMRQSSGHNYAPQSLGDDEIEV